MTCQIVLYHPAVFFADDCLVCLLYRKIYNKAAGTSATRLAMLEQISG